MCEQSLNDYITEQCALIDAALDRLLPAEDESPETIHKAMRYSIFAGGKRMRPVLCLAAAEACGGLAVDALVPACAVEMMHTYSLIHDDLPAMDNDDLRRGKPTSHKAFGEGVAILAGDALLTEAFAVIAQVDDTERYTVRDYVRELAATGGSTMLIGGQILDLEGERKQLSEPEVRTVYEGKTAALQDLGIADVNNGLPATGTGTDGITLITNPDAPRYTDAGTFSVLGSLLASAAYETVRECLELYDKPWNRDDSLATPPAVDLSRLRNKECGH